MIVRISILAALGLLGGCGGQIDLSCDEPQLYQQARESARVTAPDGLTQLEQGREMPVPKAAPQAAREPGLPCLDIPPRYLEEEDIITGG